MIAGRNQPCSPDENVELSMIGSENHSNEPEVDNNSYLTHLNKEETNVSSDDMSDSEVLLITNESTHKRMLSWSYSKQFIKNKVTMYWGWFQILFKNGYWRTTLLLWYLW